ncbi:elongation of very long chain fatty acids protein 6-like [Centruroides sculpturatus]|uniref:elongation of very long chain fatty acids protein 6-like n=1 Tax=Centruroides sculpturatus TaxID=218467 RepID=UPI000C6CAD9F|nr:elongation of very long chain fatty acids protein 6-like [Centruroides sculpturatus]
MKQYHLNETLPSSFQFEALFTTENAKHFVKRYWSYTFHISAIYLLVIYFLRQFMKSRSAFDLRRVNIIWNGILALFSICFTIRVAPILMYEYRNFDFIFILCDKLFIQSIPRFTFWALLFLFSKILELGDTLLIVLRKRRLMFLHWYHHVVTLVLVWFISYREVSIGIVAGVINGLVHSFMYLYFTVKAMNIRIPTFVAMFITAIQTLQMMLMASFTIWMYWRLINKQECDSSKDELEYIFLVYLSYLFLFIYLFYNSYIRFSTIKKKIM